MPACSAAPPFSRRIWRSSPDGAAVSAKVAVGATSTSGVSSVSACLPRLLGSSTSARAQLRRAGAASSPEPKKRVDSASAQAPRSGEPGDPLRAPSVHYLSTKLLEEVQAAGFSRKSTIYDIDPSIIRKRTAHDRCPRDGREGAAFVDVLRGADNAGRANFMLSYTWGYSLGDIVDALVEYCQRCNLDMRRTYVWICCFCMNQHRIQEAISRGDTVPFDTLAEQFSSRVRSIGHILSLMDSWRSPRYITRAWCIYELYVAMEANCKLDVIMTAREGRSFLRALITGDHGLEELWQALEQVDVRKAEASIATDRESILQLVEDGPGANALNQRVRSKLQARFADVAEQEVLDFQRNHPSCAQSCKAAGEAGTRISIMLMQMSEFDRVVKLSRYWISRLKETCCEDAPVQAVHYTMMGGALLSMGDQEGAGASLAQALRICTVSSSFGTLEGAHVFRLQALLLGAQGDVEGGLSKIAEAYAVIQKLGATESKHAANVLTTMAVFHSKLKQFDLAALHFQKAHDILTTLGRFRTPFFARLLTLMAYVDVKLGYISKGLAKCEEAHKKLVDTGSVETSDGGHCLALIAWVMAESGNTKVALQRSLSSLQILENSGMSETVQGVESMLSLAHVRHRLGDLAEAESLTRQASRVCSSKGLSPLLDLAPVGFNI